MLDPEMVLHFGFLLHTRGDKITTRNTTEAFLRLSTDIFTLAFFFFARCLYVCRHRFCGCYRFQVLMLASVHVLQQIYLPICFNFLFGKCIFFSSVSLCNVHFQFSHIFNFCITVLLITSHKCIFEFDIWLLGNRFMSSCMPEQLS